MIFFVVFFVMKFVVKILVNCDFDEFEVKLMVCGQNKRVGINLFQYVNNVYNFRVFLLFILLLLKIRLSVIFYGLCLIMNDFDLLIVMG